MSKKNIILLVVLGVLLVVSTLVLTVFGNSYLSVNAMASLVTKEINSNEPVIDAEVHFVDVPNVVITLSNHTGRTKSYLLLDLVLLTDKETDVVRIETTIPLIRSTTVDYLTNMNYQDVSSLSVGELRNQLFNEYSKAYLALRVSMPFNDVMISKMVFQ